jgi:hypothetical protein
MKSKIESIEKQVVDNHRNSVLTAFWKFLVSVGISFSI